MLVSGRVSHCSNFLWPKRRYQSLTRVTGWGWGPPTPVSCYPFRNATITQPGTNNKTWNDIHLWSTISHGYNSVYIYTPYIPPKKTKQTEPERIIAVYLKRERHLSTTKRAPGCLGYIYIYEGLANYVGIIMNHYVRIPIKQPVFHGKYPSSFLLVAHLLNLPTESRWAPQVIASLRRHRPELPDVVLTRIGDFAAVKWGFWIFFRKKPPPTKNGGKKNNRWVFPKMVVPP